MPKAKISHVALKVPGLNDLAEGEPDFVTIARKK
jgi:hypothetical protein